MMPMRPPWIGLTLLLAIAATAHAEGDAGAQLYVRWCASCHGADGRGDGPAAQALTPPPSDLTRLERTVPELMRTIDGSRTIRAHGSGAMPVWGEVFEASRLTDRHARRTALLQVQELAEYVYRLRKGAKP